MLYKQPCPIFPPPPLYPLLYAYIEEEIRTPTKSLTSVVASSSPMASSCGSGRQVRMVLISSSSTASFRPDRSAIVRRGNPARESHSGMQAWEESWFWKVIKVKNQCQKTQQCTLTDKLVGGEPMEPGSNCPINQPVSCLESSLFDDGTSSKKDTWIMHTYVLFFSHDVKKGFNVKHTKFLVKFFPWISGASGSQVDLKVPLLSP